MSKRACIAIICFVLVAAALARPQYEEEPHHHEEYNGGDEHREHEHEHEPEYEPKQEYHREEPSNYYPREEYNTYDNDEHYASLTLQEVKVQDFQWDDEFDINNNGYSYKALFTCGKETESAKECGEALRHNRYHGEQDFLQTPIVPEYMASCTVHLQDRDPLGQTALCWAMNCLHIDFSCSVFNSAKKCGCPMEPGFGFNATGSVDTFAALSCSPTYLSNGLNTFPELGKKKIAGSHARGKKAVGGKRTLLADNSAKYFHPHNETIYSGTAIVAHAHVTASSASYNYEVSHQLEHAKVVYVGGFVNGVPVSAPEEGGYNGEGSFYNQLPFVTGGLLKLIVKK